LIGARLLAAQTLTPTPGSIQDASSPIAMPHQFSFEPEIQSGTQGTSNDGNPFAFQRGLQIRSWLHYDGVRDLTVTGAASYVYYFTVPGTSNYKHSEWRFTGLCNLRQRLAGGSLYEQLRFELLNFRAANGAVQHLPRVRLRLGQNLSISESRTKPYLGLYEEAITQYPQRCYSGVHFQGARFFAGYGFDYKRRTSVLFGFKAGAEVSSSGSTVTLFYGPVFSVTYNFFQGEVNERHRRTTAFKVF